MRSPEAHCFNYVVWHNCRASMHGARWRTLARPARLLLKNARQARPRVHSSIRTSAAAPAAPLQLLHWLGTLQSDDDAGSSDSFACILQRADSASLASQMAGSPPSSSLASQLSGFSSMSTASRSSSSSLSSATAAAAAADAFTGSLVLQHVAMPDGFTVPSHTTVPAYQFVSVFRGLLGHPQLHQSARASSLEAKWGLLRLLLVHADGCATTFDREARALVSGVLLPHAARKLAKVHSNPLIPELNKQQAEERYHALYNGCIDAIATWAASTVATAAFKALQPVMAAVADRLAAGLAAGHHTPAAPAGGATGSGRLMERTVLGVLQAALPAGWSLLPNLHLLGADGDVFDTVSAGCKYEVDLLVLDESATAVAIVEVKLGAANPLMALFNDAASLLRLVDTTAGRVVTAITRSQLPAGVAGGGAGSRAAGVAPPRESAALVKARAATATAPFGETGWRTVHVRMHEAVQPVYVLGKGIGDAETLKGLCSLVDSSALKLLARSAEAVQGALLPAAGSQQQQQQPLGGGGGSSSSTRVSLQLSSEQQDTIQAQLQSKIATIQQRCLVYSLLC